MLNFLRSFFFDMQNIVLELQRCEADTRIINANGDRAIDITQSEDIMEALKGIIQLASYHVTFVRVYYYVETLLTCLV